MFFLSQNYKVVPKFFSLNLTINIIVKLFFQKISFPLMSAQRNLPAYRGPHITYAVVRPFGVTGTHHHHQQAAVGIIFIIWILYNRLLCIYYVYIYIYNIYFTTHHLLNKIKKNYKYFISDWLV